MRLHSRMEAGRLKDNVERHADAFLYYDKQSGRWRGGGPPRHGPHLLPANVFSIHLPSVHFGLYLPLLSPMHISVCASPLHLSAAGCEPKARKPAAASPRPNPQLLKATEIREASREKNVLEKKVGRGIPGGLHGSCTVLLQLPEEARERGGTERGQRPVHCVHVMLLDVSACCFI